MLQDAVEMPVRASFACRKRLIVGAELTPDLGKGWKHVSRIATDETLITKVLEDLPGGAQRFHWLCLDVAEQRRARLPAEAHCGGGPAPGYRRESNELFFLSSKGITSFNLTTKAEQVLIPIDQERNHVERVIFSSGAKPRVLYLLGKRDALRKKTRAKALKTGEPVLVHMKSHSLFLWDLESATSQLIATFKSLPASLDAYWSRDMAYALIGAQRKRQLVKISLSSREVKLIRNTDPEDTITVSPRHSLLTWRYNSPGIVETFLDGEEEALVTNFGWYPSFSPDGQQFAFTVGDYEIWIKKTGEAEPEMVASLPATLSRHSLDRITWCLCGKHFAVCLAGHAIDKSDQRPLMIVDCDKREVLMHQDLISIGTSGERTWVPGSAVKDYFDNPAA